MDDTIPAGLDERKAVIATLLFDWTLETANWRAELGDEQIESLQTALADLPGESLEDYRRFWRWARSAEPNSVNDATVTVALDFLSGRMPAKLNLPLDSNEESELSERAKSGIGFDVAYQLGGHAIDALHEREAARAWGRDGDLCEVGMDPNRPKGDLTLTLEQRRAQRDWGAVVGQRTGGPALRPRKTNRPSAGEAMDEVIGRFDENDKLRRAGA
jgi:hypothetical protein